MSRSRLVLFSSSLVVAAGLLAAAGALVLTPAQAAVGPLPAEGLVLPADARFVMGVDVKRLVASPLYQRGRADGRMRPQSFTELEDMTGINPERDLDLVVVAGAPSLPSEGPAKDNGVVFVQGRFDRSKLTRFIERSHKGEVTWKNQQGTTVYLYKEAKKDAAAIAFLDEKTLVLGPQASVETTVARHASGDTSLKSNGTIMTLLGKVRPDATFWMVGDQSMLAQMPKQIPGPAGSGNVALPGLNNLVVTGDLDPDVALQIVGEAKDEAAAKSLADLVRGFVALATLQAEQKPELKAFATAVGVTTEASTVRVSARLPYSLLDSLAPKKAAAISVTPAAPSATPSK